MMIALAASAAAVENLQPNGTVWAVNRRRLRQLRRLAPSAKVIGGTEAEPYEFPFNAALLVTSRIPSGSTPNVKNAQDCGASLLDPTDLHQGNNQVLWALTAGHCCKKRSTPDQWSLLVHGHNLRRTGAHPCTEIIPVAETIRHPDYDNRLTKHDVCLLKMSREPTCGQQLKNDGLLMTLGEEMPKAGFVGTLTGWGTTTVSENKYPNALQEVSLKLKKQRFCKKKAGQGDIQGMICTFMKGGQQGGCSGDSGSPYFYRAGGKFVQIGINSWGAGKCAKKPEFYASVPAYRDWIKANVPLEGRVWPPNRLFGGTASFG